MLRSRRFAPRLETMNRTVHKFRRPALISSDAPVHFWRRPTEDPEPRGVGIETADEVRFPLSPSAFLVMDRGPSAEFYAAVEHAQGPRAQRCSDGLEPRPFHTIVMYIKVYHIRLMGK